MNGVRAVASLTQKRTEGVQVYPFVCYQDDVKVIPDNRHSYKAYFSTIESLVKTVDMSIKGDMVQFDSSQIRDLPAGIYRLEIWEIVDDVIHGIYPSDRPLKFTVKENAMDLPEGTVSSLTLDEFEKRFNNIAKNIQSGGSVESPKFSVGKTETVSSDQPASVEMLTKDDGTIQINFKIPKGEDGKTYRPYIADDGYWHVREEIKEEN
ncbi:hypothetical protein AALA17_03865 [Lactobacillaceae bacterium 24-114]